ncbi:aminotransferase class IV family protein [Aquamicrobium ahrensii]|uniref:Probable branched-chain-amino-acid aminotransferase n=1 Tax=Aquamicrobium ahrensii TaxID=469551 RepID=A0ABV2KPG8_9HYPH
MPAESPLRDGNGPGFKLIETLRWEPAKGFLRLERHLARLAASAHALGFACAPDMAGRALEQAVTGKETPQRMRLLLGFDGSVEAAAQPFQPLPQGAVWTLRLATARLSSADGLLRHKTTRRHPYEHARAEYPATEADEVLLLNERGELCEGVITSLFADFGGGAFVTPPLDCGLLAGILREELIDQGRAVEGVITPEALRRARAIFMGNSLRGLISARLLP